MALTFAHCPFSPNGIREAQVQKMAVTWLRSLTDADAHRLGMRQSYCPASPTNFCMWLATLTIYGEERTTMRRYSIAAAAPIRLCLIGEYAGEMR